MTLPHLHESDPTVLRFSMLKTLGLFSPAHLAAKFEVGMTPSIEKGTALHALVFGTRRIIAYTEGKARRGKDWEAFQADHPDEEIVTAKEFAEVDAMAKAVRSNVMAMRALEGVNETTFYWNECGIKCRGTPDAYAQPRVTELKTDRTSNPRWFPMKAIREAYHGQLVWYGDGLRVAGKADPFDFHIVAVENRWPCIVTVYRLSTRAIEAGRKLYRSWFERFQVCRESGIWPPYSDAVCEIDTVEEMPDLVFPESDDEPEAAGVQEGDVAAS